MEMKQKWDDLGIKDKIQYIMAVVLLCSGILAAFVCIIFNSFNIANGVLIYIAQAFITAGGIFGVSIYFKSKLGDFESKQKIEFCDMLENVVEKVVNNMNGHHKNASEERQKNKQDLEKLINEHINNNKNNKEV